MKILVFEYITGGGFSRQALPESLYQEGGLMLRALLDDLARLNDVQVHVMIDRRCIDLLSAYDQRFSYTCLTERDDAIAVFSSLLVEFQFIWPIAPETDEVLFNLSQMVEQSSARLLNSSSEAVSITGSKLLTSRLLNQFQIACVKTVETPAELPGQLLVKKPVDGVGCEGSRVLEYNDCLEAGFVYQEYLNGDSLSLSCLFKQGEAWLISVNKQDVVLIDRHFVFQGCQVNIVPANQAFQALIQAVARVLPGLWGYVGIDLIVNDDEITVLEINPRLTTSYAGIFSATGVNVAGQVIQLINHKASIRHSENGVINIKVNGACSNAA